MKNKESIYSNKKLNIAFICAILLVGLLGWLLVYNVMQKPCDCIKIDLPEEIAEVSKDSTKPTILQGYYNESGKLMLGFYHSKKQVPVTNSFVNYWGH